jgi:RHS repeat-associated protein
LLLYNPQAGGYNEKPFCIGSVEYEILYAYYITSPYYNRAGEKDYELTNHLSNVITALSDKKIGIDEDANGTVYYYLSDLTTAQCYYAFGSLMPGRNYSAGSGYRYGYQGSEKDNEIYGDGNAYTTHFRMLDPRIGRWLSVDPEEAEMPWQTPYNSMDGNPILKNDPNGDCPWCAGAILGAAVEYGSQVAGNIIKNGGEVNLESFTDVDVADIVVSGIEGGLTGGGSVITKTLLKEGVKRTITTVAKSEAKSLLKTATSEAVQAAVDIKAKNGGKVEINTDVKDVAVKTAIGVGADKLGGVVKTPKKLTPQMKVVTPKEAVKAARDGGKKLNTAQRLKVEAKAGAKAERTKIVNDEIKSAAGKTATGGAKESQGY